MGRTPGMQRKIETQPLFTVEDSVADSKHQTVTSNVACSTAKSHKALLDSDGVALLRHS